MGYDIFGDGEANLPSEKVAEAIAALKKVRLDALSLTDAQSLVDYFDGLTGCFYAQVDDEFGSISIHPSDDSFRRLHEDRWVFEAIASFLVGEFQFRGEDGATWRWDFGPKGFEEVTSELVWGRDVKAPHVAGEIEDLIYDSATSKIRDHEDPQAVLDQIEAILRTNGFGPFAGLEALDAVAKAVE